MQDKLNQLGQIVGRLEEILNETQEPLFRMIPTFKPSEMQSPNQTSMLTIRDLLDQRQNLDDQATKKDMQTPSDYHRLSMESMGSAYKQMDYRQMYHDLQGVLSQKISIEELNQYDGEMQIHNCSLDDIREIMNQDMSECDSNITNLVNVQINILENVYNIVRISKETLNSITQVLRFDDNMSNLSIDSETYKQQLYKVVILLHKYYMNIQPNSINQELINPQLLNDYPMIQLSLQLITNTQLKIQHTITYLQCYLN